MNLGFLENTIEPVLTNNVGHLFTYIEQEIGFMQYGGPPYYTLVICDY